MDTALRQLSLVKGDHKYVFRYSSGHEARVIGAFVDLADDDVAEFDWFDAAVLSYQMGKQIEHELETRQTSG